MKNGPKPGERQTRLGQTWSFKISGRAGRPDPLHIFPQNGRVIPNLELSQVSPSRAPPETVCRHRHQHQRRWLSISSCVFVKSICVLLVMAIAFGKQFDEELMD